MDTYKIERLFHLLMERLDRHEKMLDDLLFRSQRQAAGQEEGTEEGTECRLYNGERLYDNQDLFLMLQVSKRSLQRYRTLGILPYHMLRQKTYYKESDVEKFLSEHIDCFQKEKMADYKARIR